MTWVSKQARNVLAVMGLLISFCVCGVGSIAAMLAIGHSQANAGGVNTVHICAGYGTNYTTGQQQIGVWWVAPYAPYLSRLPPVILPHAACLLVAWPPLLPPQGGFAFPP